jgi:uncharacterized membrane protein YiaA
MVSFESVKKMMGWCPQERIVYDHNDVFFSENAFSTGTATYDEKNQYMDMPVQMFDWRIFAVMFGSIGLLLFGIQRSDTYLILLSLLLYASLFIFDRTKISVDGAMLRIRFPVLGEKKYPKSSIDKIELIENYAHRHRMRSLIALTLVILIPLSSTLTLTLSSIMSVTFRISSLLLIYVIYGAIRISHYPEIIKISTGGRNIILYPRNEHDLLMLKSIAPGKLELIGGKQ